jgi:hypothetical protein
MPNIVDELRIFKADLDEYRGILADVWKRAPGHGWYSAAIPAERQRVDELRAKLAETYGAVHDAIVAAHGSEPIVEQYGIVGGDAFVLAFQDPSDNPWLSAVMDLTGPTVLQAIGYHRMRQRGVVGRVLAVVYREFKDWARIIAEYLRSLRPS